MKIILSIILMFLSAQSFADLRGKGIICIGENKGKSVTDSIVIGWFIEDDNTGTYYGLERGVASELYAVRVMSANHTVIVEPEEIYLGGSLHILNRKTLELKYGHMEDDDILAKCKAYDTKKVFLEELDIQKNKEQKIYNKKLEGNKI